MKYRYTTVYRIRGVLPPADQPLTNIVASEKQGLLATFTDRIDEVLVEGDKYIAVANMMLEGGLGLGAETVGSFPERFASAVTNVQDARRRKFGERAFLVISCEGTTEIHRPDVTRELDEFEVWINGFNREHLRRSSAESVGAVIAGLSLAADEVSGVDKVIDFVIYYPEDGKPVYAYDPQINAKGYVSRFVPADQLAQSQQWFDRIVSESGFQRVSRLLVSSLGNEADPLHAFIASWNALEIMINKAYSTYERAFFETVLEGEYPNVRTAYLERARAVLKGKERLNDKFAVINHELDPANADADAAVFAAAKEARDRLSHGQDIDDEALPVRDCRILARKYLRLHLTRSG